MVGWRHRGESPERRRAIGIGIAVLAAVAFGWPSQAEAQCAPVDLALDTTVMGSLSPGDCTIPELLGLDPPEDVFVDVYRVTLVADSFLTVDLQSLDFDTFLFVFDAGLTTPIYSDDDAGAGTDSLITRVPLPAGTYIILTNSFDVEETGDYQLSTALDATGNPACDVVVDLPPTAIADGTLVAGDCTIAQLGLDGGDQTFVDQYRVALPAGGTLTIALDSVDFDPFLAVLDETLTNVIATDDDGGSLLNSLLSDLALAPGTYVILANHFDFEDMGAYTLTLTPEPSAKLLRLGALVTLLLVRRRRPSP